ncbi:hypothetical protein [Streptomyces sp. NBC_00075]|uniref:MmyB family transcriptional regulator n=1 Tax=Streptomyces sp. NBC_00075 TaxID=2975641 RepID=UPI0038647A71
MTAGGTGQLGVVRPRPRPYRSPSPPVPFPVPGRTVRRGAGLPPEGLRPGPARVVSRTGDVFAADPGGGVRLLAGTEGWPAWQRDIARHVFRPPGVARDLFANRDNQLCGCTARLRAPVGTPPPPPIRPPSSANVL